MLPPRYHIPITNKSKSLKAWCNENIWSKNIYSRVDIHNCLGRRRKYDKDAESLSPFWGSSVIVWQLSFPYCHHTPFELAYSLISLMSKCAMLRLLVNHVSTFAIVSDDGANTTNTLSRCPRFGAVAWKYGS